MTTNNTDNPILNASTVKAKLGAAVTTPAEALKEVKRLVEWHLNHMLRQTNDREAALMVNLGEWRIVCRLSESGSLGGNAKKDSSVKGHYCPSGTNRGEWLVDGMKGKELSINVWNLHDMTDEDWFNFVIHESIHAYSDLTATTERERDCAKNGAHKKLFAQLVEQSGLLDVVEIPNSYAKLTTVINDEGRKAMAKLKATAPNIGKVPAKKKAPAKRARMVCDDCALIVMVPIGKYRNGGIQLRCMTCGTDMVGDEV